MSSIKTQPRSKQRGRGQMNKAQEQAMRVRAAQTVPRELHRDHPAPAATEPDTESRVEPPASERPPARSLRPSRKASVGVAAGAVAATAAKSRVVAHPFVLSKHQEYAFIKADLVRLVTTMAVLFVIMLILLYFIEG